MKNNMRTDDQEVSNIPHLTEEELLSAAEGNRGYLLSKSAAAHLEGCQDCNGRVSMAIEAMNLLASLPVPEPAEDLFNIIETRLRREAHESESPRAIAMPSAEAEVMTPEELASFLRIPTDTVYELLQDIPHLNLAGQIRFRRSSVLGWLDGIERNSGRHSSPAPCDLDLSPRLWREGF